MDDPASAHAPSARQPTVAGAVAGPWAPLHSPLFRMLWIATVASKIGTWVNDTASAWVMTEMSPSPLLVSLVQAATTLPICLLAIPAGVLADIVDRRRLLLAAQSWMAASALVLTLLAQQGLLTPTSLLALTFALGVGAAFTLPAWQATVPELVDRSHLSAAIALGSLGINIARAIGPALGGALLAALSPAAAYGLNAVSFLGVIAALWAWRRELGAAGLPPEEFSGAVRAGFRYVRNAPAVHAVLIRALAFFLPASATWALLPVIARHELGGTAVLYGGLLAGVGAGAVLGALVLPRVLRHISRNRLAMAASLAFAAAMLALAALRIPWLLLVCMLPAGAAWLATMTSFQVAAQTAVPAWVRARTLALNIVVFAGAMAGGGALWGALAAAHGVNAALALAAGGVAASLLLARRFPLGEAALGDVAASAHWPEPIVAEDVRPDRGPVLVTVEYRVDPNDRAAFLQAIGRLSRIRKRDGAARWGVFEDAAEPGIYLEAFIVESWLEHLRQHARVTVADRAAEDAVGRFHRGPGRPRVRHFLAGAPAAAHSGGDPSRSPPAED